jgi:uncharacterized radical SAM protein YgiQ
VSDASGFLPVSLEEMNGRGIEAADFVVVSGDAYVDHPSFGHAVIARAVEAGGFAVGIIAQPVADADYRVFGAPKKAFLVTGGVVDSMVNNYTVARRKRTEDVYSEAGLYGRRPDRALTVYCKALKRIYPDTPVIIGGIEASLRRLSHYDYWTDSVLPSVLIDSGADLLIYGMGERPISEICSYAERNIPLAKVRDIPGTAYLTTPETAAPRVRDAILALNTDGFIILPSHSKVSSDKTAHAKSFKTAAENMDGPQPKILIEKQDYSRYAVVNPPAAPMSEDETDFFGELPYMRAAHPAYTRGVPALTEVEFSVTSHRGCFGNCAFCALTYHQGRAVSRRSARSVIAEAASLAASPRFKGYIHDIGGPSANFYGKICPSKTPCRGRNCVGWESCASLKADHTEYLNILRAVRALPKVKKVFVRSGVRFDYVLKDTNKQFLDELVKYHVSGQLKVAPEHVSDRVLKLMNKPPRAVYERFEREYYAACRKHGLEQYLVPYYISSHPGSTLEDAIALACSLRDKGYMPLQVQDFYPTPATRATVMYHTGIDPDTMQPVYVPKTAEEKRLQRALLQYRKPENYHLVKTALTAAGRTDLIGQGKNCLIPAVPPGRK